MIPILQFDPSSMSIWYDAHLINRMKGGLHIGHVLNLALRDDPTVADYIAEIEDDWVRTRSATIASAVWHEKRHFLDFALTNYGAFRVRQFFSLYLNMPSVIAAASKQGELLVPLQSYLEKIYCKTVGIREPDAKILAVASDIRSRKRMIADDRRRIHSRFGSREVGGEALLEALAHHFETIKAHIFLGPELLDSVRQDIPDEGLVVDRYKWLYEMLYSAGLIESQGSDVDGRKLLLATPFVPICYAALACRLWKQPQTFTEDAYSYLPGYRLASLLTALVGRKSELLNSSVVQCWDIINEVCIDLFGVSALDEMRADIAAEGEFIERARKEVGQSRALQAYSDYHELRETLFSELVERPENIIADFEYAALFSSRIQPIVVVAASSGELGNPPSDYDRLFGFVEPDSDPDDYTKRWWWAAMYKGWPQAEDDNVLCLKSRRAWIDIISDLSPFAKLLMDGRNVRTMLGPELISADMRLRTQHGINIKVDRRFAVPRTLIEAANWYYLIGQTTMRCELTFKTLNKPEGVVVDPWMLRLWPSLLSHLTGKVADQENMMKTFQRDWSPWTLSEEFRELLEDTMHDPSLFVGDDWG